MSACREHILDLLSNGPSSFAAVYRFVVQGASDSVVTVRKVMSEFEALESEGIVHRGMMGDDGALHGASKDEIENATREYEQWLEPLQPGLSVSDVSLDEIGVWLELRRGVLRVPGEAQPWTLDVDASSRLVTVQATDESTGLAQLNAWAERSGAMLRLESVHSESHVECHSKDGERFVGTKITCEFTDSR